MSESWTTKAFSNNTTPVELSDDVLNEEGVIFLTGRNTFNDQVYSYLKLTIGNLQKLKTALKKGEHFMPSDFGTVLAAGKGEPSDELRSEMAVTYKLIEVPKSKTGAAPVVSAPLEKQKMPSFAVKDVGSFWDE